MAISPEGELCPFAEGNRCSPAADWKLISIVKDVEKPKHENR
jgi:hypothetical protein